MVRSSKGTERAAPVPTKFEVGLCTRFLRPWLKGELERERLPLDEDDLEEGEQDEFELPETDPDLDLAVHMEIFWGRWVRGIILRHFYF